MDASRIISSGHQKLKVYFWGVLVVPIECRTALLKEKSFLLSSSIAKMQKKGKNGMGTEFLQNKKIQQASSGTVLSGHLISVCTKLRSQLLKEMLGKRWNPSLLSNTTDKISRKMHSVKGVFVRRSVCELT